MSSLPYGTMAELRLYTDTTITAFEIVEGGRSGVFYFDAADATTADDGSMTVIQAASSRRFKRQFHGFVRPEWFGVTPTTTFANETIPMQASVNFLTSKGGGLLQLSEKIYVADLVWNGNNNISVQGVSSISSVLMAASSNQFAIRVEAGSAEAGNRISEVGFYGGDFSTSHGLYLNCATQYYLDHCVFRTCGVGVLSNGSIDHSLNTCIIKGCYIGVIFGTYNSGYTTITDINGHSLTVTPAFTDTQPCEQTLVSCQFFANKCHIVVDYPSGGYAKNANVKLYGGAMQAAPVGIYIKQAVDMFQYGVTINGVWIENALPGQAGVLFNGVTMPVCDYYFNGGIVSIENSGFNEIYVQDDTIVNLINCALYTPKIHTVGTGTVTGENITGEGGFIPCYFNTAINGVGSRSLGFYTKPKTRQSKAYPSNKKFSETHGRSSVISGAFGAVNITKIDGGLFDGVCWNIECTTNNSGLVTPSITVEAGKLFVCVLGIKTEGPTFSLLCTHSGGTSFFMNNAIDVTNQWKSVAIVGKGTGNLADQPLLYNTTGSAKTFQLSGMQILKFDTIGEMYSFLQSEDFAVDQVDDLYNLTNSSTSAPTKATLNSAYGSAPSGTLVNYLNISAGARDYKKLTDSVTSDWVGTVWATGVKSIVP